MLSVDDKTRIKKIRFQTPTKVLFNCDSSKIEDLNIKNDHKCTDMKDKSTSLFSFLQVELTRDYLLEHDEERYSARREKVYSFMKIPREVEQFMRYGFMQCIDSFLFVYTFLPMRVILAIWALISRTFSKCFGLQHRIDKRILTPAEICDLLKAVILIVGSMAVFSVDTNMLYHLIKSQSVIKLYIFYNMLEVGDRLFSAFGQDTIDALFWTATEPRDRKREHLGVIPHLIFAIIYVILHGILVLLQATTLNVAINSNNKALLTIMMSNNFVELKGSVFKKFDKNNLFQVSCSDVRERFHLVVLLFIVVLQTMREYSWKFDRFAVLLVDCLMVLTAEMFVDWIKHAFITRFNELQLDVYRDYTTSLAYDMAQTRQKHAFSDHSDLVARRMGFIPLPLGVVMIRVLFQAISIDDAFSFFLCLLAYICLIAFKVLNSLIILGMACDLITQHKQERASVAQSPSTSVGSPTNSNTVGEAGDGATPNKTAQATPPIQPDLASSPLFVNSTVDLKNVTLNDELLKVDNDEVKIKSIVEDDDVTRSFPELVSSNESLNVEGMKRAESEPTLIVYNNNNEDPDNGTQK